MRPRILEERPRGRFSIRSRGRRRRPELEVRRVDRGADLGERLALGLHAHHVTRDVHAERSGGGVTRERDPPRLLRLDRKSTRLNSSHITISYAVFCLKKKIKKNLRCCPVSCRLFAPSDALRSP